MSNKKRSIRFDERTWMILNELASKTGTNISIVVRSLVTKGLDDLVDQEGNLKINEGPI